MGFSLLFLLLLRCLTGQGDPLVPRAADLPLADSPLVSPSQHNTARAKLSTPTNVPDFRSSPVYVSIDEPPTAGAASPSPAPQRRAAAAPHVRCALNRTAAALCSSGGTPFGCSCDRLCHVYGDCCGDASSVTSLERDPVFVRWRSYWWSCRKVATEIPSPHYLMVSYCPGSWQDPYTERLCRHYNLYDRLLNWPVHDAATGALFKNVYCATCNGVKSFVFWSASLHCVEDYFKFRRRDSLPSSKANVTAFKIKLDYESETLGKEMPKAGKREGRTNEPGADGGQDIRVNAVNTTDEVERILAEATLKRIDSSLNAECSLQFTPVQTHSSRSCLPFKSECDASWVGDVEVKLRCLNGDTNFAFDASSLAYRNEFCAQCSFVDKLWCFAKTRRKKGGKGGAKLPPLAARVDLSAPRAVDVEGAEQTLSVLLRHTPPEKKSAGKKGGSRKRGRKHSRNGLSFKETLVCPPNQIYDVFHDRCRLLTCVDGVIVNDTLCQPKEKNETTSNARNGSSMANDSSLTPCDGLLFDVHKDDSNDLPFPKIFRVLDFYSKIRHLFDTHADDEDFLYNEKRDSPFVHCYQSHEAETVAGEDLPAPFDMGGLPLHSFFAALGQGVSVLALLVCILLCLTLEDLRHSLLSSCLACIYLSLALCQVAMVVSTPAFHHEDLTCVLLLAGTHFTALTTLTWIVATAALLFPIFAYSGTRSPLYCQELFLRDPRASPQGHRRNCLRFSLASIFSWLMPFPLTAIYILKKHESLPPYSLDHEVVERIGLNLCWPSSRDSFLTYFAVPAGAALFLSLLLLATVSAHAVRSASAVYPATLLVRSWANRLVRVVLILAALWGLCLAAVVVDLYALWTAFVCGNSLTGVLMLLDILASTEMKGCSLRICGGGGGETGEGKEEEAGIENEEKVDPGVKESVAELENGKVVIREAGEDGRTSQGSGEIAAL